MKPVSHCEGCTDKNKEKVVGVSYEIDDIFISSDFETGNGKNITKVGENSFRVEAEGDAAGYNWYFSLCVTDRRHEPREVTIEVVPDPDWLNCEGCCDFAGNLNTHIWLTKLGDGTYYRFPEFNFDEPGGLVVSGTAYRFSFMTVPGHEVKIANCYPLPYSLSTQLVGDIADKNPGICRLESIGKSFEGRDVSLLEVSEGKGDRPKVLIIAGQHPMEFPGQWALWGIVRWLTSSIREAVDIRRNYRFFVIPTINPDGNVAGRPQKNAQDLDLNHTWQINNNSVGSKAHENVLLLELFKQHIPDICLNFHGYPGPRAWGDWPHEGCYVPKMESFADPCRRNRQSVINDYILWETDGGTQHQQLLHADTEGSKVDTLYDYLAVNYGTLGVTYEPLNKGPWLSMRTGIHVFKTLLKGYEASANLAL